MDEIPSFLDFEASSLSRDSYPIEVAWSYADGSIENHLISPETIVAWTEWDPEAERVHGIRRKDLLRSGETPSLVCARMNQELAGKTVYTDAPSFDGMWLSKLFAACDATPLFELGAVDDLLAALIRQKVPGRQDFVFAIDLLKKDARVQKPRQHRAAWDVEYLVQLWRLAVNM
jgi:hypothetical protein